MNLSTLLQDLGLEANAAKLVDVKAAPDHVVKLLGVAAIPLEAMCRAAAVDGIKIVAVSGFRSVGRQTRIWNRKFKKAVRRIGDRQSSMCKVLEFSAPPGWSRHHWGCDVDLVADTVIDDVRLEPEDWHEDGECAAANEWLEQHAADYGFIKPYDEFRGGFLAEPWHWSFAPTSVPLMAVIQRLDWRLVLRSQDFDGADLLAAQVNRLFPDFVVEINPALR